MLNRLEHSMDAFSLISSIVQSMAWPVTTVFIVFLLRSEIKLLFKFVSKIKAGPVEASFEREVKQLEQDAKIEPPPTTTATTSERKIGNDDEKLLQLSSINPRSAILEAWRSIETTAEKALERKGKFLVDKDRGSIIYLARELLNNQVLNHEEISILHELRSLRNDAAHAKDFSPKESSVLSYLSLSRRIKDKMMAE